MLQHLKKLAVLLALNIMLVGAPVGAGDTTGLVIPEQIKEIPSELKLSFVRDGPSKDIYGDVKLFRDHELDFDGDGGRTRDTDQTTKSDTLIDTHPLPTLTHPDFPGLFIEGLGTSGDLGRRLTKLREPIRGPPVILNLSGHTSEGAQMLNRLTSRNNRLERIDAQTIDEISAIDFSSFGHKHPIVFAHLEIAPDGRPMLGNPDGKNMLHWDDMRESFDAQGVSPIVIACKSECLKGADFATLSNIDVNEVELAFQDLHKAKTLGELLSKLSSVSAEGMVVRVSKTKSGRAEVVVAGRGYFDSVGGEAGDRPPRLADAGSGGRRPRGPDDGDGGGGPKGQPGGMSILIYAAFPIEAGEEDEEDENAKFD